MPSPIRIKHTERITLPKSWERSKIILMKACVRQGKSQREIARLFHVDISAVNILVRQMKQACEPPFQKW
jgi:transposase